MGDVEEVVEVPDKGNPNVFKTYKGLYKVPLLGGSTTPAGNDYTVVGLTCTNELHFMDNINATQQEILDLSEIFTDTRYQYSAVAPATTSEGEYLLVRVSRGASGNLKWYRTSRDADEGLIPSKIWLNGITMNISGVFYRNVL